MSEPSGMMPNHYDRTLGALQGLPDTVHTRESMIRVMPFMGIGGSQLFVIQTYRQRDEKGAKDTVFLEHVSEAGTIRLVIPPEVAAVIHRQYDSLTGKSRSKAARQLAADRKERGEVPFVKKAGHR